MSLTSSNHEGTRARWIPRDAGQLERERGMLVFKIVWVCIGKRMGGMKSVNLM